ncbi:DUF4129 domain-containing protein [Paenibacillus soyae]|uniref:DUF4129 domain-containing protein n=1 Tax=Paenibacillus soyae TaxID=2969249 RepID=A0A9X2MMI4_9BACL|nr:DUF4129 domain-containing protein [Paenibacillus soyae]MCR2802844.1 DUF4129 domain-containing protein [Paenibacillus soyae]
MTKTKAFAVTLAKGYAELAFYLPILLLAVYLAVPSRSAAFVWLFTLPVIYLLPNLLLRPDSRVRLIVRLILQAGAGFIHFALAALAAGSTVNLLSLLVCGTLGAIFAGFGFAGWRDDWRNSFRSMHMIVGVIAYLACQPIKMAAEGFADYAVFIDVGAVIALSLFVIIANERHLSAETVDTHRTTTMAATRRLNRMLVAGIAVLVAFLLLFRRLREWLEETVLSFLRSLFGRGSDEAPLPEPEQQTPSTPELPMTEPPGEPSAFMKLLELIFQIGVTVLLAALALVVLYFVCKKIYRLLQQALAKLAARQGAGQGEEQGFTDEVESLTTKERRSWGLRFKPRNAKLERTSWNELGTNAERARFLYREWLRQESSRGYETKPYLSPRETAEDIGSGAGSSPAHTAGLVSLYELARYGEREPSDEAVEKQRQLLEPERKGRK